MSTASHVAARTWVQYTHLDKAYGYLPGMADAQHRLFDVDRATYDQWRAEFDANARHAADELLNDPDVGAMIDAVALPPGYTVLAVGDSITDDLQSWAEILRHILDRRRPDVRLLNAGLSAHTTAMILRSWPARLDATRPDLVLCCLGGNDVTRIGDPDAKPQVSLEESIANLRWLYQLADRAGVRDWLWITPPTVNEQRVDAYPPFQIGQSTWRNRDLHRLSAAIRSLPGPTVDLTALFGDPADPRLVGPDGVHPTIEGQQVIARAVIDGMVTTSQHPEGAADE